jgi:DNA mismatch repair protein MutS
MGFIFLECNLSKKRVLKSVDRIPISCGFAAFDPSTGKSVAYESHTLPDDHLRAFHDGFAFLTAQNPQELVIYIHDFPSTSEPMLDEFKSHLYKAWDLKRYDMCIFRVTDPQTRDFLSPQYHEACLHKLFAQSKRFNNIFDELGLDNKKHACTAFIMLLEHVRRHNEKLVSIVERPITSWSTGKYLELTHNSMIQLQLIPETVLRVQNRTRSIRKNFDSVLSVVDRTRTSIGSRFLRQRLLHPSTDVEDIEFFLTLTDEIEAVGLVDDIVATFKNLPDIERLHHKLEIDFMRHSDLASLITAYNDLLKLYTVVYSKSTNTKVLSHLLFNAEATEQFNDMLALFTRTLDVNKLGNYDESMDMLDPFVLPGTQKEFDDAMLALSKKNQRLSTIVHHLERLIPPKKLGKGKGPAVIVEFAKHGKQSERTLIHTTSKRASTIIAQATPATQEVCGELVLKDYKADHKCITSKVIEQCIADIEASRVYVIQCLRSIFSNIIAECAKKRTCFNAVEHFVKVLDFATSNAVVSKDYAYHRPRIVRNNVVPDDDNCSFAIAQELRHVIVERTLPYVKNHVAIGKYPVAYEPCSLVKLIYGNNNSGKTTFGKALGIVITMAQAGMRVPATLTLRPYKRIFTRLTGNDDLLRGESSFTLELKELKPIIEHADKNTLVLADELCRGTESGSGTAIVCETIVWLIKKRVSLLTSTHMHHLPSIDCIVQALKRPGDLKICHLATTTQDDEVIYDRELKPGPGDSSYGLEVARSIGLNRDFLEECHKIRNEVLGVAEKMVNPKTSRYSSSVYMDRCMSCHKNDAMETHHIQPQRDADANGIINGMHKNHVSNLIPLCKQCHLDIEHGNKSVTVKQVVGGYELVVTEVPAERQIRNS